MKLSWEKLKSEEFEISNFSMEYYENKLIIFGGRKKNR
jgi:hypothetical protein